jgi:ketosteroid isomerase-like protein
MDRTQTEGGMAMRISLIVGSLAAAAFITTAALADDKDDVEKRVQEFVKAVLAKEDLKAWYTPTSVTLPDHGAIVKGPEATAAYWAEGQKVVTGFEVKPSDIRPLGADHMQDIGSFVFKTAQSTDEGKYVTIWRKHDGAWKIETDIWNTSK